MPDVSLRLLGVPRVDWNGGQEPLPRNTPASLLAYLAVAGDWVARQELAYLYRPDDDEAGALQYLRLQLHRAQRFAWSTDLEVRAHEVRWRVATDLARLREAHGRRDWVAAIGAYGGPLLATFDRGERPTFDAWVELERGEAQRLYAAAVEARAEELETERRYGDAAELWRARVALDELDEDATRAYLRLLGLAGRKDEALGHYRRFAELVRREFDLEPAEETRALAERIRSDAAPPLPAAALPPRPARNPLPQPATRFVGRRRELAELHRLLVDESARLATLIGLGGSGKTRLALAFAHAHRAAFDGGAYFVAAEAVATTALLADRMAASFDLELDAARPAVAQLVEHLGDRSVLLLLDNLEHLPDVGGFLSELLADASGLRVVATSRQPLRLSGEWLLDVRGLAHPADDAATDAGEYEAVELFVAAARRVAPQLAFGPADVGQAARICGLLEGLPLALELAATWTRVMPLARIADEIARGFDLLASDLVDVPERHRSMRAVLDRTWEDLSASKKRTLARLSTFAGGCTLEAAERVTGAHLSTLLSLVNQSLLQRQPGDRFASHPLVSQYAADVLAADPAERSDAMGAHARYFAERLQAAHDGSAGRSDALRALEPDAANLEQAWFRLLEVGELDAAEAAAGPLFAYYDLLGHDRRGLEVCAATLERLGSTEDVAAARLRCSVQLAGATMAREAGVLTVARAHAEEAAGIAAGHGLAGLVARANQYLGDVHQTTGTYDDAAAAYALAIAGFEALGNTVELANTLNSLASMEAMQERYDAASERFLRCVELFEAVDDPLAKAIALNNLGYIAEAQGRHAEAAGHYEAGLAVFERLAFARGIAAVKNNLIVLYGVLGRLDEAEAIGLESLALKRSIHDTLGTIITLKNLGDLQLRRGALDAAAGHYLPAIRTARELAVVPRLLQVLVAYADYALRAGRDGLGRRLLEVLLGHPLATPSMVARARELHPAAPAGGDADAGAFDAVVDEVLRAD
jgi:predicted ATPase/DNA-binding SARP family transcriptional activator